MFEKKMFVCLRVSSLAALIGVVFTLDIYRRPFGPKMCQDLCRQTPGCTSYVYLTSDLSCHITDNDNDHNENEKQKYVPDKSQVTHVAACPKNSKVIQSRTKGLQCVKSLEHEMQGKTSQKKKKWTRIILFSVLGRILSQVFMFNKVAKRYPKPTRRLKYHSVAYIPSSNIIIFSTDKALMSSPLDTSRYTTLNSSLKLSDMAVDDDKRLVFMLTINVPYSLIVMNITNCSFQWLHRFKENGFVFVAIDEKQNISFVKMPNEIQSLSYDGKLVKSLHKEKGMGIGDLTMDSEKNVLYFISRGYIKKMSLSDNKLTTMKGMSGVVDLIYDDNVLYITTFTKIKKVRGNKTVDMYKLTGSNTFRMCLVP